MTSSAVRYLAVGALVAGLAAIAWTALRSDDSGGGSAVTVAPSRTDDDVSARVDSGGDDVPVKADSGGGDVPVKVDSGGDDVPVKADSGGDVPVKAAASSLPSSSAAPGGDTADETAAVTTTEVFEPIEVLGEADTLTGLDGWLNTSAASLEEIRAANTITVVQFWTFGCRNCKNTLEALGQLYADFRDEGVEIVGVHSPEFSYEADVDNIIEASADLGVVWPIALDTDKRNFHRWQPGNIGYWPRVYVIDGDNQIRFDRTGDGRATYAQLYETVERLLAEA